MSETERQRDARTIQRICAWCGPGFTALFALGGAAIGRMIPPRLHPHESAEIFVAKVMAHQSSLQISAFVMMMSVCLMAPWGGGIAARFRPVEGKFPALSFAMLCTVGTATAVAMMMAFFWAIMCFRPDEYGADLVLFSADMAYFMPLFSWPIFSIWCWLIGIGIVLDRGALSGYPPWIGWFNFWAGFTYIPGGLILFFKRGVFAWDGIFGLYVPYLVFFVWILIMAWATLRAIAADGNGQSAGRVH